MVAEKILDEAKKLKIEVDYIVETIEYISNATYIEEWQKIKIIEKLKNDFTHRSDDLQKLDDGIEFLSIEMLKN